MLRTLLDNLHKANDYIDDNYCVSRAPVVIDKRNKIRNSREAISNLITALHSFGIYL